MLQEWLVHVIGKELLITSSILVLTLFILSIPIIFMEGKRSSDN